MKKLTLFIFCFLIFPIQSYAFSDIDKNTHRENIEKLVDMNILQGYEDRTFRPNEPITRGQAITALSNLYGNLDLSNYRLWSQLLTKPKREFRSPNRNPLFQDVQYIYGESDNIDLVVASEWFYMLSVINGYKDGYLRPSEPLKRIQLATMLQQLLLFPNEEVKLPFKDVKTEQQRSAVRNLYAHGITTGTSASTFSPNKSLTRGQFATLLVRTMTFLQQIEVSLPVKVIASEEIAYDYELENNVKSVIITKDNAAQYNIHEQQLQNYQYVAYSYVRGSGCGNEISNVTQYNDALHIEYMPSLQVLEHYSACTESVHIMQDIFQFDLFIDVEKVTINGLLIIHDQ